MMSTGQNIKKELFPLIKGLPVIAFIFIGALFIAKQYIKYTPSTYQAIAMVKLDDQKYGFSNNSLYKDFDIFSAENKIVVEEQLLSSQLMINKALDSLDFEQELYRVGKVRETLIYEESPFTASYSFADPKLFDRDYNIAVNNDSTLSIRFTFEGDTIHLKGRFDVDIPFGNSSFHFAKNNALLSKKKLNVPGNYRLHIYSREQLISHVSGKLDAKALDKEISILRIVYKDQTPQRAADFTNTLCKTYIQDYVETKSLTAAKTVEFIDQKLQEVERDLDRIEFAIENFKTDENIVNTFQETGTGLREISDLRVALINLEMNEKAVRELQAYVENGEYFDETAIGFGFGDLLMTELVKKLKHFQDEKRRLLTMYTPGSDEIRILDENIAGVKKYIKEAIRQNLRQIEIKRENAQMSLQIAEDMFTGLASQERRLKKMEREFRILENVHNFLAQKKMDASIAESAMISFHRIIQVATAPKTPISPNATLITFVSGFLGLLIGVTAIYMRNFARAKIQSRDDIEKHSEIPVKGVIRKGRVENDVQSLVKVLILQGLIKNGMIITISSAFRKEGKTTVVTAVSEALREEGYQTEIAEEAPDKRKVSEEILIIDASPPGVYVEGIEAMKKADLNLFILRAEKSSKASIYQAEMIKHEYALENIHFVLNSAHKANNFSGTYVSSRLSNGTGKYDFGNKFKRYFETYFR
jgi:uncharacterized protein involved in exopolysaccharide biosynthesis